MGVTALPYITLALSAYGAYSADQNAKAMRPKDQPLVAPPQETKIPDQSLARRAGQTLLTGAGQSTSLTGPRGVPGSSLSLGVNTLLGS